jgi:hypothetical protein
MSWEEDHRDIWSQINETKQEFAKHSGACEERHREIIRRQDESMRDRHGINLKLDDMKTAVHALETRALLMLLSAVGSVIGVGASIVLQFVLKQ